MFLLTEDEVALVVSAFLRHEDRREKGAKEEDIIEVITWANALKVEAALKLGILYNIYRGEIVLNLHEDNTVFMSLDKTEQALKPNAEIIPMFDISELLGVQEDG